MTVPTNWLAKQWTFRNYNNRLRSNILLLLGYNLIISYTAFTMKNLKAFVGMFCFMLAFLTVGYSSPHGPQTTQKTDMVSIQEHVTIDLVTIDAPICNYACSQVLECSHVPVPAMQKVNSIFDVINLGSYIYCPPDNPIEPFSITGVVPLNSKRVVHYPRPVLYHT